MHSSSLLSFVLASVLISPSLAVTITQASQLKTKTYDYIIVGAGNAGLVVANRLTEDPNVSVLVLEAGVSDQGVLPVEVPFLGPTVTPNTPWDWNYTITAQQGMGGRTFPYPRGKILGGSSSANYLFHQFGTDEDWNRLGSLSGDSGWTWANMKQYVQKHEKFVPPVDGHNTTGQFIPSLHGFKGEVSVSLPGNNQTIDPLVLQATKQLAEFPFNEDTSGGDHSLLGIGFLQSSAGGGVRSSSSTSYLANANGRPNLTVLIDATVVKLLQTGTAPQAPRHSVASNSRAHPEPEQLQQRPGRPKLRPYLEGQLLTQDALSQWVQNKTGMFANNVVNNFGFARIPSNATIFKTIKDPAAGPKSPHWELILSNFFFSPGFSTPSTGSFMTIIIVLISPTSRGTVKIRSTNPFDQPLINPQYLTTDFDIFAMREAVKAIKRLAGAPAFSNYATTDAAIESYVRGLTTTIFHPVGTAAMSTSSSKSGVVGPDLKVKGADGLRVIDASVFPFIPSCHTQGPVYLLAERASDIIKKEDGL
ncbi:hypothetical protein BDZ97DRAFT_1923812 [Flammula alnicola]|nr:hypothetical protein BDZ97DRAFT_1923812 [Flammula alnicola]